MKLRSKAPVDVANSSANLGTFCEQMETVHLRLELHLGGAYLSFLDCTGRLTEVSQIGGATLGSEK